MQDLLNTYSRCEGTDALGPGRRAVLWVQGCGIRCPGCLVPDSWDPKGGERVSVESLVQWFLELAEVDGLTISGGEPFDQAAALGLFVSRVKAERDVGVMCYTGYRLEHLMARATPETTGLLSQIDILIDGPYVVGLHRPLLWRGSANQRVILLTDRYRAVLEAMPDVPVPLEVQVEDDASYRIVGVPSVPGFRERIESGLEQRGVELEGLSARSPKPRRDSVTETQRDVRSAIGLG